MMVHKSALARGVTEFLDSMPAAYARAFTLREVEQHANIVARRESQLAHAEAWHGTADRAHVCVVADDRPGLLSLVTDALLAHGLNVASAEVYCRHRRDGKLEAVDFFRLQPSSVDAQDCIDPDDLVSFTQTLRELIAEEQLVSHQRKERDTIPVPGPKPSRFYFDIDALRVGEFSLIVETPDFNGLLFAITSALHGQGIRILASEVRTEAGIALDRFKVESSDEQPLSAERLADVQHAVRTAVMAAMSRG